MIRSLLITKRYRGPTNEQKESVETVTSLDCDDEKAVDTRRIIHFGDTKDSRDMQIAYILQHIQRIPAQLSFATSNLNGITTSLVELVEIAFQQRYFEYYPGYDEDALYIPGRYIPYNPELMDLLCEVRTFNKAGLKDKLAARAVVADEYDFGQIADYVAGNICLYPTTAASYAILRIIKKSFRSGYIIRLEWNHLKIVMDYLNESERRIVMQMFCATAIHITNLHKKILMLALYDTDEPTEITKFVQLCRGEFKYVNKSLWHSVSSTLRIDKPNCNLTRNAELLILCNTYTQKYKYAEDFYLSSKITKIFNTTDPSELDKCVCEFQKNCELEDAEVVSVLKFIECADVPEYTSIYIHDHTYIRFV